MNRTIGLALAVLLLAMATARAGEPTDDEKRAEAHRTVFRRFSAKAETTKLGLGDDAAAVVDILLDLARNQEEVRNRRAPRSTMFMGSAHGITEVEDGTLVCHADFVNLVIDRAEMPLARLPAVLDAALDEKRFAAARTPGEAEAGFRGRRRMLVVTLARLAAKHLADAKEWRALAPRVEKECFAAIEADPGHDLFQVLECLVDVGGDATATKLIENLDRYSAGKPAYQRGMYVRVICRIPGKVGEGYLLESLDAEDPGRVSAALNAVGKDPSDAVLERLIGWFRKGAKAPAAVTRSVLSALERTGSPKALALIEAAWKGETDEGRRYALACALTRMGGDAAIPYLRKKLAELEARTDVQAKVMANVLRRLLEKHE